MTTTEDNKSGALLRAGPCETRSSAPETGPKSNTRGKKTIKKGSIIIKMGEDGG